MMAMMNSDAMAIPTFAPSGRVGEWVLAAEVSVKLGVGVNADVGGKVIEDCNDELVGADEGDKIVDETVDCEDKRVDADATRRNEGLITSVVFTLP